MYARILKLIAAYMYTLYVHIFKCARVNVFTYLQITLIWNVDSTGVVGTESNLTAMFSVGIPGIPDSPDDDMFSDNNVYTEDLPVSAITSPRVSIILS